MEQKNTGGAEGNKNSSIDYEYAKVLYSLYTNGIGLQQFQIDILKKFNFELVKQIEVTHEELKELETEILRNPDYLSEVESDIDKHTDVVINHILIHSGIDRDGDILKKDWDVIGSNKLTRPKGFVKWINSINKSFREQDIYIPFHNYVAQAEHWVAKDFRYPSHASWEDKLDFTRMELRRIKTNTLYFIMKYGVLKEGDVESGGRRILPYKAQKIMCYLFDLGVSFLMLKPRQIGMTSLFGLVGMKKIKFQKSSMLLYITENDEKGVTVLNDKFKYPLNKIPKFLFTGTVSNAQGQVMFGSSDSKGDSSIIQIKAPTKTVISSTSPQVVFVDEAGNMPMLNDIVDDGRPTLFWLDPVDRRVKMKRQMCAWGTGGQMNLGGGALETMWESVVKAWDDGNYDNGIIPIFFDLWSKEGIDETFVENERLLAYSKKGVHAEAARVKFHQSYPRNVADVFLRSSDTFVSMEIINSNIKRINSLPLTSQPKYGYFEPILDYNSPDTTEGSDLKFKIIGANWIPVDDANMSAATAIMIDPPQKTWIHRYYSGFDPISTASGYSLFAGAVWDNYKNKVSCVVNFRVPNYKYCYQQALLMNIYYNQEQKMLIEIDAGAPFKDYIISKGYRKNLVYNAALPQYLRSHTLAEPIGINKKEKSTQHLLNTLQQLNDSYAENIDVMEYWMQMKTFTRKSLKDGESSTFKTENAKYYHDDLIWAINYAYLNGFIHSRYTPYDTGSENPSAKKKRNKGKLMYQYDENFNIILENIK